MWIAVTPDGHVTVVRGDGNNKLTKEDAFLIVFAPALYDALTDMVRVFEQDAVGKDRYVWECARDVLKEVVGES